MSGPADQLTFLGYTTHRRMFRPFGIRQADRLSHQYVIGKTGVGKSTYLEAMALQDMAARRGVALCDPHGDLAARLIDVIPPHLQERVRYLNAPDPAQPFGYNPLRQVREDKIPLAASGILDAFRKLWADAWGVRMEQVLRASLYTLLERPGSTLPDVLRLYADQSYRRQVTARTRNPIVRGFWLDEFEKYPDRYRAEVVAPIQTKLRSLLSDPTLYRILVTPTVDLHLRALMDEGGILIVNLAKGRLGEDSSAMLGSLLVSTVGLAALSRADAPARQRLPFHLHVDEFQSFTTLAFANMMSEVRKYGLSLTLAHQFAQQIDPDVRHAVLGNAGSLVAFRVGADDAELLAREFQPTVTARDLISLPNRHFYVRLMIDGEPSKPFSAVTLHRSEVPGPRSEYGATLRATNDLASFP